jgi:thiamine pyrophosphate-dependent acetolactate synthase large subunit-like protein
MTERKTDQTVRQMLAAALSAHGIKCLFGLVGDANLFMVDSFIRDYQGRYVAAAHEASAVLMALGHAQVTGEVAVATITHGPALTNAMTALVEGVKGGVPMVLLCGDTPPEDLQHLQKINQRELIAASGAGFVELRGPETAAQDIAVAFRRAAVERRPIVFNMRVDLQWQACKAEPIVFRIPDMRAVASQADDLDQALGIIAAARRPIILAGRGAISTEARSALLKLSERIEAPLATTLKASGLFHGEPWNLGVFGGLSHPVAVDIIVRSDCVIAFGASLSRHTTESGAFLRGKRVIQVMQRPEDIGLRTEPSIGIVGDPALTADLMREMLTAADIPPSGHATEVMRDWPMTSRAVSARPSSTREGTVDIHAALTRLDAAVPSSRILVTDLGRFVTSAWRAFPVEAPRAIVHTVHFGAIGCGLGEAIGAAVASEGRPTLLVSGDGGFIMGGLTELGTAVREKLDLIVVICNDSSYGAEHVQFINRSMDPSLSMINSPDFVAIAQAMGAEGVTVRSREDIELACKAIATRSGPLVIDLKLDPDCIAMD